MEPLSDKVREIVSDMADELRANMKNDMQALMSTGGNDGTAEWPMTEETRIAAIMAAAR